MINDWIVCISSSLPRFACSTTTTTIIIARSSFAIGRMICGCCWPSIGPWTADRVKFLTEWDYWICRGRKLNLTKITLHSVHSNSVRNAFPFEFTIQQQQQRIQGICIFRSYNFPFIFSHTRRNRCKYDDDDDKYSVQVHTTTCNSSSSSSSWQCQMNLWFSISEFFSPSN